MVLGMTLLSGAVLIAVGLLAVAVVDLVLGIRRLEQLGETVAEPRGGASLVSIVVAARDEARGIEAAMRSLLAQQYPALEIIAVDDRSGDSTGEVLDRLAATDPRLQVIHVRELPSGWLGKNHALAAGARVARGTWLLFTDADVVLAPTTVLRAVAIAERRGLDHLAVFPDIYMQSLLLQAFVTGFSVIGMMALRPWSRRAGRRAVGIGAFNLVRASKYAEAGGHEPIRLRPDDDLQLGTLLQTSGARQDALLGRDQVGVEWYPSVASAIDGLMKNSFAVVGYRSLLMLGGFVFYLLLALGPFVLLVLGDGLLRVLGGTAILLLLGAHLALAGQLRARPAAAVLYPVVELLLGWIVLRALVVTLARGGIVWRGTFYPLSELRKNRI